MSVKSIVSFISRLSKRERAIFYVTAFIVGLVLLDRFMLSPILAKISDLDEAIGLREELITQSLLIVTQEKRIERESSRYAPYLSVPQEEEKEKTAFLKDVENIAKKSLVYLIDIKPAGKDAGGGSTRYFVKLDFEAQMEQVFNFFYGVTHFEQLMKIEGYQIKPKTEGSSIVTCSMSVSKAVIPQ
jgi:hypothetical protein